MDNFNSNYSASVSLPDEVEFIQAICVNVNDYALGKMFPREKLASLLENKEEISNALNTAGSQYEIPTSITELSDDHYENNYMVPDVSTLRVSPWSKDSTLAMVFCDAYDRTTNSPMPFNPRLLAKNKMNELEQMGYKLFVGVENEFRLFDKVTRKPFIEERCTFNQLHQSTIMLPYFRQLRKTLKSIDVEFDCCHMENGYAQVEVALKPYSGIEGVDKVWLFKHVSKHVAYDMGLIASYMTLPLHNDQASGLHVNHSLWQVTSDGSTNSMWEPSEGNELSQIGQHWLAGLLKHAKALSAFFSPTVNCYRRVRAAAWAPNQVSWNYRDRSTALRVKVSKDDEKSNFIENRLPSGACNIYLVIAGMIAAGLDGIKNQLELPEPGNGPHCDNLPRSLNEALQHLREDKLLSDSLGEKFVDWYIKIRQETDVDKLKDVDIDDYSEQGIAKEIDKYFNL